MADAKRLMRLNRNFTLDTIFGHSVRFEKDVPMIVPPVVQHLALAIGAEYVDGEGVIVPPALIDNAPVDQGERAKAVLEAVSVMADRNNRDDFSAAGLPKVDAVSKQVGFKVGQKEVTTAWQARADALLAAKLES